jgi:mycothiol synthase
VTAAGQTSGAAGVVDRLTDEQLADVLGLVSTATHADEVAPLSEEVLLDAREGHPGSGRGPAATATSQHASGTSGRISGHYLSYAGTHLAGYAHLERGNDGGPATAEVVVDPPHRRQGVGTGLVRAVEATVAAASARSARSAGSAVEPVEAVVQLWSHGDLDSARAFARRGGYSRVRDLWQMRRSLRPDSARLPAVRLPDGFRARHFVVGQDEEAWLKLNARAFADHPEQGRMTRSDVDRRIAEPWFDARGLILIEDARDVVPVLAASHWTKVAAADELTADPTIHKAEHSTGRTTTGEVYVVGVDPAYQGMGLGTAVTVLGLTYLRDQGLTEAMLYVDGDNRAAVSTYARLAFTRSAADIMYSRIVHMPV